MEAEKVSETLSHLRNGTEVRDVKANSCVLDKQRPFLRIVLIQPVFIMQSASVLWCVGNKVFVQSERKMHGQTYRR